MYVIIYGYIIMLVAFIVAHLLSAIILRLVQTFRLTNSVVWYNCGIA